VHSNIGVAMPGISSGSGESEKSQKRS